MAPDPTDIAERFLDNIETVVHGKREQIKLVVAALMCGGHALLEDVPGTAKTVLARAIAGSIRGAQSRRASSARRTSSRPTSPASRSSTSASATSSSGPGPVFANVVLVDEINRAMPKTQSALLEAMAEQQVTVDGETRRARGSRSSSWRRRTRSSTKARSRCPRRSSTASS